MPHASSLTPEASRSRRRRASLSLTPLPSGRGLDLAARHLCRWVGPADRPAGVGRQEADSRTEPRHAACADSGSGRRESWKPPSARTRIWARQLSGTGRSASSTISISMSSRACLPPHTARHRQHPDFVLNRAISTTRWASRSSAARRSSSGTGAPKQAISRRLGLGPILRQVFQQLFQLDGQAGSSWRRGDDRIRAGSCSVAMALPTTTTKPDRIASMAER